MKVDAKSVTIDKLIIAPKDINVNQHFFNAGTFLFNRLLPNYLVKEYAKYYVTEDFVLRCHRSSPVKKKKETE